MPHDLHLTDPTCGAILRRQGFAAVRPILRRHLLPFGLACLCLAAQAERLPFSDAGDFSEAAVLQGVVATREQCQLASNAVWADAGSLGAECIRYWKSGMGLPPVRRALVFMAGDTYVGVGKTSPVYLNSSSTKLQQDTESWSRRLGVPYVFLARPGVYGSSGDHMQRRRLAESLLVSAALDAIKWRYGVSEWVIAGQSGGGHVTSSLLTLRSDIICAVPTSAPSSPRLRWEMMGRSKDTTGFDDSYEPGRHLRKGRAHPELRVFVLGDPHDSNVFWPAQKVMGDALAQAGMTVRILHGEGSGPQAHGLSNSARQVAAWCARDLGTEEILRSAAKGLKG